MNSSLVYGIRGDTHLEGEYTNKEKSKLIGANESAVRNVHHVCRFVENIFVVWCLAGCFVGTESCYYEVLKFMGWTGEDGR